ncbi:nucleoporin-62 C-terminal-like protein [Orycteropus afer afer]|uniref:Nucleoporin-62 C-terminal-like protein n=1 Tax=Orycteropus afer afer TaxID=1230840 RepID=A0AC54ZDM6_ORYAF|nr:nucleoporin-62 C-terminal-like protein [Orycteropus afer afer]
MTYGKLHDLINNWHLELEDYEKHFLYQANRVNAWDRILIENGEKIITLHGEMEKVKLSQKRLEQELNCVLSQQKELEDLLIPLEESVEAQSRSVYLQYADDARERTYKLSENIDAQLKHIAQDLRAIIEYLNTFGPADTTEPIKAKLLANERGIPDFKAGFTKEISQLGISEMDVINNMDKVPVSFNIPVTRAVPASGTKTVAITTTGFRKAGIMCYWNTNNKDEDSKGSDDDDISSEITEKHLQAALSYFSDDSDEGSGFDGFQELNDDDE